MFDGCKVVGGEKLGCNGKVKKIKGVDQKQMVGMTLEYLLGLVKVFQRTISN